MNKERRKAIQEVMEELETLKSKIEEIQNDEQEAYDNLPESLQYSERGEAMESAIENLESAYNEIDSIIDNLEEAQA